MNHGNAEKTRAAARALAGERLERARAVREKFIEQMPEGISFIQDLLREGLIDGWRDVTWVGTAEEWQKIHAEQIAPRALTYRQFVWLGQEGNQRWTTCSD